MFLKKRGNIFSRLLGFGANFLVASSVFLVAAVVVYQFYRKGLPTIDEIVASGSVQSVDLFYSDGMEKINVSHEFGINRDNFRDIPSYMVDALLATEDKRFFSHRGVDFQGIARAMLINLKNGRLMQGGSTITQQLAKILIGDSRRTAGRKIRELILTRELEKYLRKEDILTLYLSKVYFGAGQYGIREAGRFYFGKEVDRLNLQECALLVGILKAPSKYNPTNDRDLAIGRMTQVILNMRNAGFLDESDLLAHTVPDISLENMGLATGNLQNRYFSNWLKGQLKNITMGRTVSEMSVVTTLDNFIQNEVCRALEIFLRERGEKIQRAEIAIVAMSKDGEVLAMVGGRDYRRSQFNRALRAKRQTGSLFKLFVYLSGFENGLEINDNFVDEPIKIGKWYPENYGKKYEGQMTVREAFMKSSNSVAVQIADRFGLKNVVEMARKSGLGGKFRNDMTIVLGSQESTLLEMVAAYATVLNGGIPAIPHGIRNVSSSDGILYTWNRETKTKPIYSSATAEKMLFLLYSSVENGTGRRAGVESLLDKTIAYNMLNGDSKFFIGGKTGSSQNNNDAWFIGFANDIVIGIWIGNDGNQPMNSIMGGNLPAELWKSIVENLF
ncbi:MAG: transglycosylase domain-containing protein [Rickettsiales bacterium]|jgi:penicillin-binding protein 1A|nr:transglycosylase domain-containing protein [Rickettsiales bacterium]